MKIALTPDELEVVPRAVAIGTFDGVHRGHARVLDAVRESGTRATALTFAPHPRTALGNRVELLTTLARRLELLGEAGVEDALVVTFDLNFARVPPDEFAEQYLRAIGTEVVVAGPGFRFGHRRAGDLDLLRELGFEVRTVAALADISSSAIREHLRAGDVVTAAAALGRAPEVEGTVVAGDARGGTLGFPTANLHVDPDVLVPAYGIYAGAALGYRAAISIGVNPHYGGRERRVEAFILDFNSDLYGERVILELWERLRDERAFASEADLIAQIERDVDAARNARPPL